MNSCERLSGDGDYSNSGEEDDDLDTETDYQEEETTEEIQDFTLFKTETDSESSSEEEEEKAPDLLQDVEEWKLKKDMRKKVKLIQKIRQCNTRIMLLEKERNAQIFAKRSEYRQQYMELEDTEIKFVSGRGTEKKRLKEQVQKISASIQRFKREVKTCKPTQISIAKVKNIMEEVEDSLVRFKEQQRAIYEEMIKNEKMLVSDLENFGNKVETWSLRQAGMLEQAKLGADQKKSETLKVPPEVKEFERFIVQTGGHQGGWDDVDHSTFLKLRRQHKTDDELLKVAETALPVRSLQDIIEHIDWYKEYCNLRERKRKAIQAWKKMKESEKQDILMKAGREVEENKQRETKHRDLIEKEKRERFEKLEDWKVQKRSEQLKRDKEEKLREREEEERKMEKLKQQAEVKAKVQEYVNRRKEEDKILKDVLKQRENEEKMSRRLNKGDIERIKERDKRILEEKQNRLRRKEHEEIEKEKRLSKIKEQVKVNVNRDPSRLLKLTKGWQSRKETDRESAVGSAIKLPHRAVPSWRQGIP